jgi:hypothetical protein
MKNLLIALLLPLLLPIYYVEAAEIIKATKKSALIQFDPFEENLVVGDRLVAYQNGVKMAQIEITKIKGNKILGRILAGQVKPGFKLEKFGVITKSSKKTSTSANNETVTIFFATNSTSAGIPSNSTLMGASVDIKNSKGVEAGLGVTNAASPATSVVSGYVGYSKNQVNWSLAPYISHTTYTGITGAGYTSFSLYFEYNIITFGVDYTPNLYGGSPQSLYYSLDVNAGLGSRWKSVLHVGYSSFSQEERIGFFPYMDYKVGAIYSTQDFSVEFAWTDTNRKNLSNIDRNDGTAAALISKEF